MGKRFSDYIEHEGVSNEKSDTINFGSSQSEQDILKAYNEYSKFSDEELLKEFLKVSAAQKQNGSLTKEEIEKYKKTLFPMLSEEQKKKFELLIGLIF